MKTAPPSPPPKLPTGLKREMLTPGTRRSAVGRSFALRSLICSSVTMVVCPPNASNLLPSMIGGATT